MKNQLSHRFALRASLGVVVVFAALVGPLSGPASAHTTLPTHTVAGSCTANVNGIVAVSGNAIQILPDYRAGTWWSPTIFYEQYTGFQIFVAWKDGNGAWRYQEGQIVAGRNGDFSPNSGKVYNSATGRWDKVTIGYGIGTSNPSSGQVGLSATSTAVVPAPGEYWVMARYTWYPLNLVNTAGVVVSQVQGSYVHDSVWTKVNCPANSYLALFGSSFVLN